MLMACVPYVGDGLAAGIRASDGQRVEIDCGSQRMPGVAAYKGLCCFRPTDFFLSHFHWDHYNGLLYYQRQCHKPRLEIERVFFPRIPEFPQRQALLECVMAMNYRVVGYRTGSREADFLAILRKINARRFTYWALCRGDTVSVGREQFEILWPPRVIEDEHTLAVIRRALEDFNRALEEDPVLREIYRKIGDSGVVDPYLQEGEQDSELLAEYEEVEAEVFYRPGELPGSVKKAIVSLGKAANHLSLAFVEADEFLFLGDLEKREIRQVVTDLSEKSRKRFRLLITPHHGTHWDASMNRIRACWAVSSVGSRLLRHVSRRYDDISCRHFITARERRDVYIGSARVWWALQIVERFL